MIDVYISNECFQLVQANALLPFKQTGVRLPDGSWKIPIEEETAARLSKFQLKGETLSDTIYRVLSTQSGKN